MDQLFVHSALCVHKVTLVDDDVIKVMELFGMANHAADGGEGDAAYLLLVEGSGVDGYIQYAVAAHLCKILLENFFAWLEYQCMTFKAISNVGNNERFTRPCWEYDYSIHLCIRKKEIDSPIRCLLLVLAQF